MRQNGRAIFVHYWRMVRPISYQNTTYRLRVANERVNRLLRGPRFVSSVCWGWFSVNSASSILETYEPDIYAERTDHWQSLLKNMAQFTSKMTAVGD